MHIIENYKTDIGSPYISAQLLAAATAKPPFGPGFQIAEVTRAASMEVWGTGFGDSGEYCEFVLKDREGKEITRRRISGY